MSSTEHEVNGERLEAAVVRSKALELRLEYEASGQTLDLEQRVALQEQARELLIDRMLLVQEARRLGFEPRETEVTRTLSELAGRFDGVAGCRAGVDTPDSRNDLSRRLMVDRVLAHWRASVQPPRNEEVRNYYRQNRDRFYTPELIHASHFVRNCESDAGTDSIIEQVNGFRDQVSAGADFGEVARLYSDCPENGGDLGWFGRGVMVDGFDQVVFSRPVNELTPVFRTPFGFHFAIVHSHRPEGIRAFDEVRSEAANAVWLMKQDREIGRQIAGLRARATIKVVR